LAIIKNKILDKKTEGILSTLVADSKNYADLRLQVVASTNCTSVPQLSA